MEQDTKLSREEFFEQAHKDAMARVEQYEERIVTTIKAHLAAEQSLNHLLTAAQRRKRGRTFAGKMNVAKGLFVKEMSEELWKIVEVGNDLRNAIALRTSP